MVHDVDNFTTIHFHTFLGYQSRIIINLLHLPVTFIIGDHYFYTYHKGGNNHNQEGGDENIASLTQTKTQPSNRGGGRCGGRRHYHGSSRGGRARHQRSD